MRAFSVGGETLTDWKCRLLTRTRCYGAVLAAFPRELLYGRRTSSVGTEDVDRARAELDAAFLQRVISPPWLILDCRFPVEDVLPMSRILAIDVFDKLALPSVLGRSQELVRTPLR
jgi:hypothetical protein